MLFPCPIAQPHKVCTNYNYNDAAWLASHCGEDVGGWTFGVVVVMILAPAKAGGLLEVRGRHCLLRVAFQP